jgi:hypothetical protein
MTMISREEAVEAAERFLTAEVRPRATYEVVITDTEEFRHCWAVTYNTRAYAETGDERHSLAGNGPLIINRRTGAVRQGDSGRPVEEQLDAS